MSRKRTRASSPQRTAARLARINRCFLSFRADPIGNIARLVTLCGKELGAACALYNRLEEGKLCALASWRPPPGFVPVDRPEGHLCFDVIRGGRNRPHVIRHLPRTPYARTDPNVARYKLETYVGMPVSFGGKVVGSLCVVYQDDRKPSADELRLLGIAASAIGTEEDRRTMLRDLDRRVSERTTELEAAKRKWEQEIAERKRAEEAWREQSHFLEVLLDAVPSPIFFKNAQGVYEGCNKAFSTLMGRPREQIIGKSVHGIAPPELAAVYQAADRDLLAMGGTQRYEGTVAAAGGEQREVIFHKATFLRGGAIGGLVGAILDITYLKQMERELRASEEKYRELVESANSIILRMDVEGKVTFINEFAETFFGYGEAEILGRNVVGTIVPPLDALGRDLREMILDIGRHPERYAVNENENMRRDGRRVWIAWTNRPIRGADGRVREILCVGNDITESKRTAEALRLFRNLINQSSEGIFVIEPETGRLLDLNETACTRLGYNREELLRMKVTDIEQMSRERPRSELLTEYRKRGVVTEEGCHRRKDGSTFPVEVNVKYVTEQRQDYLVAVARDVTERKRAEEEIRKLNEDLRRRAAELEVSNRELEAFSYSVSHDLRAPLRTIEGFSRALIEECAAQLPPNGRDYLQRMQANTQRMGELIDDLLKLARVVRAELHREPVDLSGLAQAVAAGLSRGAPGQRAECKIAPSLTVHGDPQLLRIVVENLLGNAWKFTARQPDARIEFGTQAGKGPRVFFVRDNGIGFDMTHARELFTPFYRLHPASEFPGSGVGLATVERIITRHGGRIWAESQPGQGATFLFTLEPGAEAGAAAGRE